MAIDLVKDVSTVGEVAPASSLCVSSLGYFREIDPNDPETAAVNLLLEQFKRPIRDGEV